MELCLLYVIKQRITEYEVRRKAEFLLNFHRINTYKNKDINVDKIFEKDFSTKSKKSNSGLGLWEVRQILKKNNNLNLFTSKNDEFFSQQFEIYY